MKITLANKQKDFFEVMRIRTVVFVIEQNVDPEIELDSLDADAVHFLIYNEDGIGVACCRFLFTEGHYKLGRLAVLKEYRKMGLASKLISAVEEYAKKQGVTELYLNAQLAALRLYQKAGYSQFGEVFDDAGIDHIAMVKQL